MAGMEVRDELIAWDRPPVHAGWRSLEPVFLLDLRVYWQNKKGIEWLYSLGPNIDAASEDRLEEILEVLRNVLNTVDGYLKLRGTETPVMRRIRSQRAIVADALESLKRGYAPGQLPPESHRLELGNRRLGQIQQGISPR